MEVSRLVSIYFNTRSIHQAHTEAIFYYGDILYSVLRHKAQAIFCVSLYTIQFMNLFYRTESSFASEKLLFMRAIVVDLCEILLRESFLADISVIQDY